MLWFVLLGCVGEGLLKLDLEVDCERYVQVAVGGAHSCAVRGDGALICWGDADHIPTEVPEGAFVEVVAGRNHTCALTTAGSVQCWGVDDAGEATPPEDLTFSTLSASGDATCGLRSDTGQVVCWGDAVPGAPEEDAGFVELDVGPAYACAVDDRGLLTCWGALSDGSAPPAEAEPGSDVTIGADHACDLPAGEAEDDVLCWGPEEQHAGAPVRPTEGRVDTVSAGDGASCATSNHFQLLCWGPAAWLDAAPVELAFSAVALSPDAGHACGVTQAGPVRCWGADEVGQSTPP
ncbi:MAG: hypothetical protein H6739_19320 [Alphaproteobacteria bacterium]|nr:hypothetical protein [Alphaproteobacteria bacterium]